MGMSYRGDIFSLARVMAGMQVLRPERWALNSALATYQLCGFEGVSDPLGGSVSLSLALFSLDSYEE